MKTELDTFDGRDNRKEIMSLLQKLGSDEKRASFLSSLTTRSQNGFANSQVQVVNHCDVVTAYFMFVSICNELGVSINEAARLLERQVRRLA